MVIFIISIDSNFATMKRDPQGIGILGHNVRFPVCLVKCLPNEIFVALISKGRNLSYRDGNLHNRSIWVRKKQLTFPIHCNRITRQIKRITAPASK